MITSTEAAPLVLVVNASEYARNPLWWQTVAAVQDRRLVVVTG